MWGEKKGAVVMTRSVRGGVGEGEEWERAEVLRSLETAVVGVVESTVRALQLTAAAVSCLLSYTPHPPYPSPHLCTLHSWPELLLEAVLRGIGCARACSSPPPKRPLRAVSMR